jgi:S-adenosyl methyltransferase
MVLAHARAMLSGDPRGATAYLDADLRDPDKILESAAATLDFAQPVAVMLVGILHCIPDSDHPAGIVRRLVDAVPSGSYLVIAHPASDVHAAQIGDAASRFNQVMAEPVTLRTHAQVARFLDGLELVDPGLVQLHRWRAVPSDPDAELANYGGVARKPA